MKIVVLGWGSLTWRPESLKTKGDWAPAGPILPIEFSRISENGMLTLVIDELNGVAVKTRVIESACVSLDDAIDNLRERERARSANGIGFVDVRSQKLAVRAVERHDRSTKVIADWAKTYGVDAAIWTAIGPRWPLAGAFTVEAAARHLIGMSEPLRSRAHEYVEKAPAEVRTPVRVRFEQILAKK